MNRRTRRLVGGSTLLAAGAVAMPLPIVPGVVLVAIGLGVLAPEVEWADRLVRRFKSEDPPNVDVPQERRRAA